MLAEGKKKEHFPIHMFASLDMQFHYENLLCNALALFFHTCADLFLFVSLKVWGKKEIIFTKQTIQAQSAWSRRCLNICNRPNHTLYVHTHTH